MTRDERVAVAKKLSAENLLDKLVKYGRMLENNPHKAKVAALEETIEVIKEELINRIMGLSKEDKQYEEVQGNDRD